MQPSQSPKDHYTDLYTYFFEGHEKANEDLVLRYFRHTFPNFTRQQNAQNADGYVACHFVLEIKGNKSDWLSGFFQGLAYGRTLNFSCIIVISKGLLGLWNKDDVMALYGDDILKSDDNASTLGKKLSQKYKKHAQDIQKKALFWGDFEGLLHLSKQSFTEKIKHFHKVLTDQKKRRYEITLKNFCTILGEMAPYFSEPIKAVRAFYAMLYGWNENASLEISTRYDDRASLSGEPIGYLDPSKRSAFKEFVDGHYIDLKDGEHYRDFFPYFDKALDAVDKEFRIKHGIFFTHPDLAKFALWYVKGILPHLGEDYFVIDPACGSGNLVSSWKSPLKFRFKVASDIQPELVYALEQRLKSDEEDLNHQTKCMIIPKGNEGKGLNFLDVSAQEYLNTVRDHIQKSGQKPDKPLAFLCNPPYRGDDDQTAGNTQYTVHPSIVEVVGKEGSSERYNCFLAQMKLICDHANNSGLKGKSLLLLFTKVGWLTDRTSFSSLKKSIITSFDFEKGFIINGKEFFEGVKGKFPIAFTLWSYRDQHINTEPNPIIALTDLCWLKKKDLDYFQRADIDIEKRGQQLLTDPKSTTAYLGVPREKFKHWIKQNQNNFKRSRRKNEIGQLTASGLPFGDHRSINKCAYGENMGTAIGFMDNLTPCRIKKSPQDVPWFRLDSQFMDVNRSRCFSGPPTHYGYCAHDLDSAHKTFLWYAVARTFQTCGYPIWVNTTELWVPDILDKQAFTNYTFAIGYAENECVETVFPAHNPVQDAPEIHVRNPMTPNDAKSFWKTVMEPAITKRRDTAQSLIETVNALYKGWANRFVHTPEISAPYEKPYFIDRGILRKTAGILQIRHFAEAVGDETLLALDQNVKDLLRETKKEFHHYLTREDGIGPNYFGPPKSIIQGQDVRISPPPRDIDHTSTLRNQRTKNVHQKKYLKK